MLMKSNSMSVTVSLEDAAHSRCHILLYSKVENAAEVRQLIMKGQVEASLIKPAMVVDTFQVIVAANKAVRSLAAKKMVTRSVFAEIIFNLSPTKNITDSLKNFGLGDGDTEILAVVLDEESGEKVKKLKSQIRGELTAVTEVLNLTNQARVKQLYKVTDSELRVTSLLDAVVSRMACKEFLVM
ncbi:EKC/KEOPS complex subunit TPRKB-like isoform X4 [Homarus americanus]|uniref:EKC/KEOPS complex subunit TPRKB-like isoform X4 n=1 Tax=Homarus americanus TaxID=6706 RepID=UPI001C44852D|nr:EKC/KEOPS complex subunit TPRKB-like isoform X4 [Homarus americanus]